MPEALAYVVASLENQLSNCTVATVIPAPPPVSPPAAYAVLRSLPVYPAGTE